MWIRLTDLAERSQPQPNFNLRRTGYRTGDKLHQESESGGFFEELPPTGVEAQWIQLEFGTNVVKWPNVIVS